MWGSLKCSFFPPQSSPKDMIIDFRREGGKERQRNIDDREKELNLQPRHVPNWESNLQPLGLWDYDPPNWATMVRAKIS